MVKRYFLLAFAMLFVGRMTQAAQFGVGFDLSLDYG